MYSPAAIENAPPRSPARPASRTTPAGGLAPESPRIRETLVTRPSLMPNTAARALASPDVAVVVLLGWRLGEAPRPSASLQHRGQPSRDAGSQRATLGGSPRGHEGRVGRWRHDSSLEQVSARCEAGATAGAPAGPKLSLQARERGAQWRNCPQGRVRLRRARAYTRPKPMDRPMPRARDLSGSRAFRDERGVCAQFR